ncbi:MAG: two-component regulator propeller domain-containing protein, partial [Bacteroidales bacterium]|nr:two-component regulator propeller domain-containing protein [Bacteroidales bacterium]
INQLSGDTIRSMTNSLGDTMITGKPISLSENPKQGEVFSKPDISKLGEPVKSEGHQNEALLPKELESFNLVQKESFPDTSFHLNSSNGKEIITGKPIEIKPEIVKLKPPRIQKGLAPLIKNDASINIQYMDVPQGMSNSKIMSLTEDINGNIWMGLLGSGASKYDGKNFYHYTVENGLLSNYINLIFADSKGNIWFGNESGGISKFDGFTFQNYNKSNGLSDNHITYATEDGEGNIWFATANSGIIKYDGRYFKFFTPREGLRNQYISSLYVGKNNQLWIGSYRNGLFKFDGNKFYSYEPTSPASNMRINCFTRDETGSLWIGTIGSGVYKFDGKKITQYDAKTGLAGNFISSIESSANQIYVGCYREGISVITDQKITNYNQDNGLSNNRITWLLNDKNNNIWAGTLGGGVNLFHGNKFKYYARSKEGSHHLVFGILQDKKGTYWFGSEEGGIIKYDGKNYEQYSMQQGLPCTFVWSFLLDKSDQLWFGTATGGVCRLDDPELTVVDNKQGISNKNIIDLAQEKDGTFWFATAAGINSFNGNIVSTYGIENGLSDLITFDIFIDNKDQIWFGTWEKGAIRYDGKNFTFFSEKEGLPSNSVITIIQDSKGYYWFGTINGLAIFDGQNFAYYTTEQGLPSNEIHSIVEDKEGGFWIGTMNGLAYMEESNNDQGNDSLQVSNYNIKTRFNIRQGLKSGEFLYKSTFLDNNNDIWWGTGKGVVKLERKEFDLSDNIPKIQITGIDINGVDGQKLINYAEGIKNNGQAKHFLYPLELELDADFNHVTFHFVATEWSNPDDIYYSYQLEGFDDVWSRPSKEIMADYKGLPGRNYTFKVKAKSAFGAWSEPVKYSLKVYPPWYNTWPARIGYVLAILLIMFSYARWRTSKLKKRKEELEKEVEKATVQIKNQRDEVQRQKNVIEKAHKDIKDSIAYAKHIQEAIFPPLNSIRKLFKESFVLYQPRDLVAGDFYLLQETEHGAYVAAADCTGHGVPGAIVSVICNHALTRAMQEFKLYEPGEILNKTREIVIEELSQSEKDVKDGMDIALCCFQNHTLKYAGAYNPVWIIRNGQIIEMKGEKQPVGMHIKMKPFGTQSFTLKKGDAIYMFSDGYMDQFGGPDGKKLKAIGLKNKLLSIQEHNFSEQHEILMQYFSEWKGETDQLDDVVLIGLKVE